MKVHRSDNYRSGHSSSIHEHFPDVLKSLRQQVFRTVSCLLKVLGVWHPIWMPIIWMPSGLISAWVENGCDRFVSGT